MSWWNTNNLTEKILGSSLFLTIVTALFYFWGQSLRSKIFADEMGIPSSFLGQRSPEDLILLGAKVGLVTFLVVYVLRMFGKWLCECLSVAYKNKCKRVIKNNQLGFSVLIIACLLYIPPSFFHYCQSFYSSPPQKARVEFVVKTCDGEQHDDYKDYEYVSRNDGFITLVKKDANQSRYFLLLNEKDISVIQFRNCD